MLAPGSGHEDASDRQPPRRGDQPANEKSSYDLLTLARGVVAALLRYRDVYSGIAGGKTTGLSFGGAKAVTGSGIKRWSTANSASWAGRACARPPSSCGADRPHCGHRTPVSA